MTEKTHIQRMREAITKAAKQECLKNKDLQEAGEALGQWRKLEKGGMYFEDGELYYSVDVSHIVQKIMEDNPGMERPDLERGMEAALEEQCGFGWVDFTERGNERICQFLGSCIVISDSSAGWSSNAGYEEIASIDDWNDPVQEYSFYQAIDDAMESKGEFPTVVDDSACLDSGYHEWCKRQRDLELFGKFWNDFLTRERFAEYHDMSIEDAEKVIKIGREEWDLRAAHLKRGE